jgi:hypothetical protein
VVCPAWSGWLSAWRFRVWHLSRPLVVFCTDRPVAESSN